MRSAQKLALSDGVLLRRLCLLVLLYCSYLTAWTALQPPLVETARTSGDLKYERCIENWFDHTLIFGKTGGHTGLNLCLVTQISNVFRRAVHIRVGIAETALTCDPG